MFTNVPSSSQSPVTKGTFATLPRRTRSVGGAVKKTPSTRGKKLPEDRYEEKLGALLIAAVSKSHETVRRQAKVSKSDEHPTSCTIAS